MRQYSLGEADWEVYAPRLYSIEICPEQSYA